MDRVTFASSSGLVWLVLAIHFASGLVSIVTGTIALTAYTMAKSKGLSDFLDALSDERLSLWMKVKALAAVWRRRSD